MEDSQISEELDHYEFQIVKRVRKDKSYSWSTQMNTKFVVVCMALGIKSCRPKQIFSYFEHYEGMQKSVISSRLQKVRNMIVIDHKLQNACEIENWMSPNNVQNEPLTLITQKWTQHNFIGFNDEEIMDFVKTL
ncbi:Conserved_hypothetical protein [Hexamita inflata]|uniref:Uncharacterized protein n=1 Tax=Hexamita inflata TaxID=28002 RepID=A0ABP1I8P6_9EUKA